MTIYHALENLLCALRQEDRAHTSTERQQELAREEVAIARREAQEVLNAEPTPE